MHYVYGLFAPSLIMEQAIASLEEEGFGGDRLVLVVLEPVKPGGQRLLDTMHGTDGASLVDGMALAATVGMVFGVIYGSVTYIGPVAMGLIGFVAGGWAGFLLDRAVRKKTSPQKAFLEGEIIVAVRCAGDKEASRVESIMKECRAVALGRGPELNME